MKTQLAVLLCVTALARADLVIVQKVENGEQSGEQTIRIKGQRVRVDLAQPVSVVTDGAGGIVSLMHAPKTFLRISAAQMNTTLEAMKKLSGAGVEATPKLTATGQKEKMGGYECEVFTANLGSISVTYWFAKDFPNLQAVLAQMDQMQGRTFSLTGKAMMPGFKDFPGMPIKTVMDMDGKKVTTVLTSVREEKVDPASFDIPKDYKDVSPPPLNLEK